MSFTSDIEIAQSCEKRKIQDIAKIAGIEERYLEQYGSYKAKVDLSLLRDLAEDLSEQPCGAFTYLSPPMMDEFIERCLPAAETELRAVMHGESSLRGADFAWKRT